MMSIGGLFLCPICPICCSWLAQKRSRRAEYLKNDSIFAPKQYDRCALAHTDRSGQGFRPLLLARCFPQAATDGQARVNRTTTKSPSPSVSSGATDDDFRIDVQNSRTSSLSPRRRRPNDKDAAPFGAAPATGYYGVQPGGQVAVGVDIEVCLAVIPVDLDHTSHPHQTWIIPLGCLAWRLWVPGMLLPALSRNE